ncbi:Alpha-mannosidase 2C1, partial [Physocladia obscura]
MKSNPNFTFTASQAQQYEWVEQLYPSLFKEIQEYSKKGQFLPVGGTWVEMDYIARRYQLTLAFAGKDISKAVLESVALFPNTTFKWAGLDNSEVLTHFAPADTYVGQCNVSELVRSVHNNKDKVYSNKSIYLYGNGDGGGGPLSAMLDRLEILSEVEGLPATVKNGDPADFYKELEASSHDLTRWKGELYFELHRGTYTSHGIIKKYNRSSENLLREVEFLSTLALASPHSKYRQFSYPKVELDRLWKLVLLNQFHDVLPGSSIKMVYDDAIRFYQDVES